MPSEADRKLSEERDRIAREGVERLPKTKARIAQLAADLLASPREEAQGIIREAWFSSTFRRERKGWAELERAWPIGNYPHAYLYGSGTYETQSVPMGVTADGRIVVLRHFNWHRAQVPIRGRPLGPRDRLADTNDTRPGLFDEDWPVLEDVLAKLEHAHSQPVPAAKERPVEPAAPEPMSRGRIRHREELGVKIASLSAEINRIESVWGSENEPATGSRSMVRAQRKGSLVYN